MKVVQAPVRQQSGVRSHRIQRPVNDPRYIVLDLDFDSPAEAAAFLEFLQTKCGLLRRTLPLSPAIFEPRSWNPSKVNEREAAQRPLNGGARIVRLPHEEHLMIITATTSTKARRPGRRQPELRLGR